MAGWIRFSFHTRVFISLLALCLLLVGACVTFQYHREKIFKTEMLDLRLQIFNTRILEVMAGQGCDTALMRHIKSPFNDLRLTVIDRDGTVIFDNNDRTPFPTSNHNNRPEIIRTRLLGKAYPVERWSESDRTDYFYSASLGKDGIIVRSAVPYDDGTLDSLLKADRGFLWIMLVITLGVSLAGYFVTRRISTSISRLNRFAERAEKGERIYDDKPFPRDELGSIASHIVRLYIQRDREHHEALAQERDKIRLKKQLTNNINHELKTPAAAIQISADLLLDHPELPEEKRVEFIERIHANAMRLSAMLKDISAITRMDDAPKAISKEELDVSPLVNEIIKEQSLHSTIKISADIPDNLTLTANRALIESIFNNLIGNAIAYSGGTEINVIADINGNFTVRDNGHGIPDEHLPHIFERFYRVDKGRSRAMGGTGLGLSIVKNAVTLHGGSITAVNDGGLRIDFTLPVENS